MKKIFVIFALAAVSLAACTREEINPQEPAVVKTVLTVGAAETKTTLGEAVASERQMYWANGDMINVNGINSAALSGLAANTATSAEFEFAGSLTPDFKALYPASIFKDASTVTLPHNAGNQVIPLGGKSASTTFSLEPLTSVLALKIKLTASTPDTDPITLIEVSTTDTRMSGDFSIDENYTTLTPAASPTGDDLAVQITGSWALAADATWFFVPVPAGTYNFTVKVMDSKGDYMTKATTSPKVFTAGEIKPLKEFEFVPNQTGGLDIDSPEKLIAFANAYNRGDYKAVDKDLIVTVTADLTFDATSSAAFNATGGIGKTGGAGRLFNGVFDGGDHTINGLTATVPLFARVGTYGTVKNVVMESTSSLTHSDDIADETNLGAIAGYSKGNITNCTNKAPVTCSSTVRSSGVISMGGIVGRQNLSGTISGCVNHGSVTCSTLVGSDNVYVGGIAGTVERPGASDSANIQDSSNNGAVFAGVNSEDPSQAYKLHMGGVVGWLNSTSSSAKMTVSGLVNTGNITKTNNKDKANSVPVLLGGIVGGIHGASIADASGKVDFEDCHVNNCTVQNGGFNNTLDYDKAHHTGGFVGVVRGENTNDITFSDNCYVKNVDVITRRGIGGGFAATAQGATMDECKVVSSTVKGSLAQLPIGGGLVGLLQGNCSLTNCIITLTKDATYSLFGAADSNTGEVNLGGLVGKTLGTNTISGCKAYVNLMYVGNTKTEVHGWVVGKDGGTTTIENCGWGGTFGNATPVTTLSNTNFLDYSVGSGTPSMEGTQYYWDASDAPAGNAVVVIAISSYATANGWTDGGTEYPQTIEQGGTTLTASSTSGQNGNYNTQWRFYQARGGGLTVSVPGGHSLVSATFTYSVTNTGVLIAPDGSTQLPSGTKCSLSGTSAFFTLGNTGSATTGQCRITKIVIEYE